MDANELSVSYYLADVVDEIALGRMRWDAGGAGGGMKKDKG